MAASRSLIGLSRGRRFPLGVLPRVAGVTQCGSRLRNSFEDSKSASFLSFFLPSFLPLPSAFLSLCMPPCSPSDPSRRWGEWTAQGNVGLRCWRRRYWRMESASRVSAGTAQKNWRRAGREMRPAFSVLVVYLGTFFEPSRFSVTKRSRSISTETPSCACLPAQPFRVGFQGRRLQHILLVCPSSPPSITRGFGRVEVSIAMDLGARATPVTG